MSVKTDLKMILLAVVFAVSWMGVDRMAMARRAQAQDAPKATDPKPPVPAPDARPADVASIDATLAALYDVISGPEGQARDWDRFRSLFAPGARLIPVAVPAAPGAPAVARALDVEGFIALASANVAKQGFYEREIRRRVDTFGHIAQVWSTYESRHRPGDPPFARGINSIQLFFDGGRWFVVSIFWDMERPGASLPEE
jgi:hypothetical protein